MALSPVFFCPPLVNLWVVLIVAQVRPVPNRPWSPGSLGRAFGSSTSADGVAAAFGTMVLGLSAIAVASVATWLFFVAAAKAAIALQRLAELLVSTVSYARVKFGPTILVALSALLFVGIAGLTGAWSNLFASAGTANPLLLAQSVALGLAAGIVTGLLRHIVQRRARVLEALVSAAMTKELLQGQVSAAFWVRVPLNAMIGMAVGSLQAGVFHDPVTFIAAASAAGGGASPPPPFLWPLLWILAAIFLGGIIGGFLQAAMAKIAVATLTVARPAASAAALGAAKGGAKGWSTRLVELYLQAGVRREAVQQLVDAFCREKGLVRTSTLAEFLRAWLLMVYCRESAAMPSTAEERRFSEELIHYVEAHKNSTAASLFDSAAELAQKKRAEAVDGVLSRAFRDGMRSGCLVAIVKCALDAVAAMIGA